LPGHAAIWHEHWQPAERHVATLERTLCSQGATVARGGDYDRWDLEIRGSMLGGVRALMTTEEHGGGKQLVRWHYGPYANLYSLALPSVFALLAILAATDGAWVVAAVLGAMALALLMRIVFDCAAATGALVHAFGQASRDGMRFRHYADVRE
jgi:O-antigen biosynthesis protein